VDAVTNLHLNTALHILLMQKIQLNGPLSVHDFMYDVLYHPTHGYYSVHAAIGKHGDFVTSPHITSLFGEMIGFWIVHQWQTMGKPSSFDLMEMGPGTGILMNDILKAISFFPQCLNAASIILLENSPSLMNQQRSLLSSYPCRWINSIHDYQSTNPLIVISNEFFDALPIHQYYKNKNDLTQIHERCIDWNEKQLFHFTSSPFDSYIIDEHSPIAINITKILCAHMNQYGGAMLMVDYGYDQPDPLTSIDTLQSMKSHAYTNLFDDLGLCDWTAHVNFTQLMNGVNSYHNANSKLWDQGTFLKAMGIDNRLQQSLKTINDHTHMNNLILAVTRLVSPTEMGSLFKALEVTFDV
jgi:NADH dehydrogenase [ubiquinone] 1 alpha subcomplex assembly factor 7